MRKSIAFGYYPYRCTHEVCRTRVTLTRSADSYHRRPRCAVCGGHLKLDEHRRKQYLTKHARDRTDPGPACYCPALCGRTGPVPHRRGSLVECRHFSETLDKRIRRSIASGGVLPPF